MGSEMKSKGEKRRIFSALLSIILCLLMVGSTGMVSYAYRDDTVHVN